MRSLSLAALLAFAIPASAADDVFAINKSLGRGINLGNALDAPNEGEWGLKLEAGFFKIIKDAGFQSVRVPVKWSAHAAKDAPFTIDPAFASRVDWVLDQAAANRLNIVLNVHHYSEMDSQPDANLDRLIGLWTQIATRYKDRPASVVFEMFNEPHDKFVDKKWNDAIPQILKVIRASNPTRPVIVGPAFWNAIWALDKLTLPDDPNLILTVHYYDPFMFTHQGAHWDAKMKNVSGIKWTGSDEEVKKIRESFDKAAAWAKKNNRPVYLGEFGAFEKADMESRGKWTTTIVKEADARGWSYAYWEFASGFGAYDKQAKAWREPLLKAMVPRKP